MTDASEPTLPDLSDHFTIEVNGAEREITMKFALLRELTRAFPNPGDPQAIFHQPELFDLAMAILLIDRDERGRTLETTKDWTLDDVEIAYADAVDLAKWAMEHVIRFFLTKLSTMTRLGEANRDQIEALLSSLPGLKDLASKKPSAGPMDLNDLSSETSTGGSPTET